MHRVQVSNRTLERRRIRGFQNDLRYVEQAVERYLSLMKELLSNPHLPAPGCYSFCTGGCSDTVEITWVTVDGLQEFLEIPVADLVLDRDALRKKLAGDKKAMIISNKAQIAQLETAIRDHQATIERLEEEIRHAEQSGSEGHDTGPVHTGVD